MCLVIAPSTASIIYGYHMIGTLYSQTDANDANARSRRPPPMKLSLRMVPAEGGSELTETTSLVAAYRSVH